MEKIKINSKKLRELNTLIKEFMADRSENGKDFNVLVEIFDNCYRGFDPDPSNDLRICCYVNDMKNCKWDGDIVFTMKNNKVIDGIHRGIAYLKCIDDGVNEIDLPNIFLENHA